MVGSGISGGWAAKELTERGLRVLMIERGSEHRAHWRGLHPQSICAPWELPFRGLGDPRSATKRRLSRAHEQSQRALSRATSTSGRRIRSSPYAERPRAHRVRLASRLSGSGGRSLTVGPPESIAGAISTSRPTPEDGHGDRLADPLPRHRVLVRPRRVLHRRERPKPLGLPQLPDGVFQPPMEFNCRRAALAKERIEAARSTDRILTIGRTAVLTRKLHRSARGLPLLRARATTAARPAPTSAPRARPCRPPGRPGRLALLHGHDRRAGIDYDPRTKRRAHRRPWSSMRATGERRELVPVACGLLVRIDPRVDPRSS